MDRKLNYEELFNDMVNFTCNYIRKNNRKSAQLGISGGIDSLVVSVLLYEVNKKLMEPNESKPLSIEAFIESIIGLLTSIVSELADLVMRELLNWALSLLEKLLDKAKEIILNEQTMYYTALMIELLKACAFKPNRRQNLDSTLDEVYYADIDPIEKPIIESC